MKLTVLKNSSLNSHDFNKVKLKLKKLKKACKWNFDEFIITTFQFWMNEWMNKRTNERTNERMNEWTNEWMNERTNEQMNECGKTIFKMRAYY